MWSLLSFLVCVLADQISLLQHSLHQPVVTPVPGLKAFVGVVSSHPERRLRWRDSWNCGGALKSHGIIYKFFVGWPVSAQRDLQTTKHPAKPSMEEIRRSQALIQENETFGDLHFMPMPDTYVSLESKTLNVLQYGYALGAEYVVKSDDDACVEPRALLNGTASHERDASGALYGGQHRSRIWGGFVGPGYVLSRDLVDQIIHEDWPHTAMFAVDGGTLDEDVAMMRWVNYAEEKHGLRVHRMPINGLLTHWS